MCSLLSFRNERGSGIDLVNPSGPGSLTTKNNVPGMYIIPDRQRQLMSSRAKKVQQKMILSMIFKIKAHSDQL